MSSLIAAHFDHRRVYDDFTYVYPVISRRSGGLSIGINLNPDRKCNFDCIYCEVDRSLPVLRRDIDLSLLEEELRHMLQLYRTGSLFAHEPFARVPPKWRGLKDIAFSGDGEPTTYPLFQEAVDVVWRVRDEARLANTKMILITDAACLNRPAVRRGLRQMQEGEHEIWAKLDAGTQGYFQMVNRSRIPLRQILKNIADTAGWCPLIIQTLFMKVSGIVPSEDEIRAYADRLNEIRTQGGKILGLQLHTIARPVAFNEATALADQQLDHIAALVKELTGLPQRVFYGNAP